RAVDGLGDGHGVRGRGVADDIAGTAGRLVAPGGAARRAVDGLGDGLLADHRVRARCADLRVPVRARTARWSDLLVDEHHVDVARPRVERLRRRIVVLPVADRGRL